MPLSLPRIPGLDAYSGPEPDSIAEALAMIGSQQPAAPPAQASYEAPPAAARVGGTYRPEVERWRGAITQEYQKQGVPLTLNGVDLVDKALHVIDGESGGNDKAIGDGGAAYGIFQSHYVGQGANAQKQIEDAVKLIARNPSKWTDWGEDTLYQGKPFGALGAKPYAGGQTASIAAPPPTEAPPGEIYNPSPGDAQFGSSLPGGLLKTAVIGSTPGVTQDQAGQVNTEISTLPGWVQKNIREGPRPALGPFQPLVEPIGGPVGQGLAYAADKFGTAAETAQRTLTGVGPYEVARGTSQLVGGPKLPDINPIEVGLEKLGIKATPGNVAREAGSAMVPKTPLDVGLTAAAGIGAAAKLAGRGLPAASGAFGYMDDAELAAQAAKRGILTAGKNRAQIEEALRAAEPALAAAPQGVEPLASVIKTAANRSVANLRAIAESRGIDVSGVTTKADIVKRMQAATTAEGVQGAARYTPEQIDQLRRDIGANITDYRAGGSGGLPPLSEAEVKQQLKEGIGRAQETPQSTLQAYLEDPTSREKGDLVAALDHVQASLATKQDLAGQLAKSLDLLRERVKAGEVGQEAAKAVDVVVRKRGGKLIAEVVPGDEPAALTKAIEREVQGLQGPRVDFPSDILPPTQADLFGAPLQASMAEAAPVRGAIPARPTNAEEALRARAIRAGQPLGPGIPGEPPTPPRGPKTPEQPFFGSQWQPGRDLGGTIRNALFDAVTLLPRVVQTALDHSSLLRQGGILIRRQKEFLPNVIKSTRGMFDEAYALERQAEIDRAPFNPRTLQITKWGEGGTNAERLSQREEEFVSRWADKIPGIKQSQRAAALFLNGMRSDVSNNFARSLIRNGMDPHSAEFLDNMDIFGNYMNRATGRGNLGRFEESVGLLNQVFYSARRNVGMVQAPFYVFSRSPQVRKEAMMDLVGFVGAGMATLEVAKMAGAEVGTDPTSADFGKIRVGNTRVDIWGGYQQMARMIYRVGDGQIKNPGEPESIKPLLTFLRNKLSPQASFATDFATGENAIGQKFGTPDETTNLNTGSPIGNEAIKRVLPLAWTGMIEAIRDDGLRGAGLAATGLIGTGVQTYEPPPSEVRDTAAQAQFGMSYNDLLPSQQKIINESPDVVAAKATAGPTDYQKAKDAAYAPIQALQDKAESSFKAGELTQPLPDLWHDISIRRDQARTDLEREFTKTFSKYDKSAFDKAIDGYYALERRNTDGTIDWDATEAARIGFMAKQDTKTQAWLNDFLDTAKTNASPLRQAYLKYIDEREKAGYFADKADTQALDRQNPSQDVLNWYWKGGVKDKAPPALQTAEAVNQALAMGLPNRVVKFAGLNREINQSPQIQQLWRDQNARIANYMDDSKIVGTYGNRVAQDLYEKPYAQLKPSEQSTVRGRIRAGLRDSSPTLTALLAYMGHSISNGEIIIPRDGDVTAALKALQARYGNAPPQSGVKYVYAKE